ncbi:MAG: fibronectin type III domain-containing protein [Gemmatimonadaceae bacterium]|nr:fibronectin type III domain-containing protein [Gemmatimonadaceae bacterium]
MSKALWSLPAILIVCFSACSKEHSLPSRFHDGRVEIPSGLEARFEGDQVVLEWNMEAPGEVLYYIVTLSGSTTGAEWQYTAPGDSTAFVLAEFAWTDSFYTFQVQAVDHTAFVGQGSNVDTLFVP